VRTIQSGLARLGYDPGPADGVAGPRTRDAVRRYQQDRKLVVDGALSPALARHIDAEANGRRVQSSATQPDR
jgi:peptidoglycan hydrolase-like protein with peptidoglycan-binding domain